MEEELSARGDGYQKGLLRRIRTGDRSGGGQGQERAQAEGGGSGEIELGLGLSLGGRFGVEPKEKGLVRSCSFSMFPSWRDFPVVAPFARTCSLPPETEEELRKRKELRSLKRLEAKRRRLEKRSPISGITIRKDEVFEEETSGLRNGGLPAWAAGAGRAAAQTVDASKHFRLASRLSTGSQGSSSSTLSDIDNHLKQGLSNSPEVKRPVTGSLLFEQSIYKAVPNDTVAGKQFTCVTEKDDQSRKATRGASENRVPKKLGRVMIEDMPCVSTKVDGPNGRRIEGFLYKYRKGEEVKIMCVCHDSFFTPAEFVKHAGGGDVAHPLRHIVVNALPSTFLR